MPLPWSASQKIEMVVGINQNESVSMTWTILILHNSHATLTISFFMDRTEAEAQSNSSRIYMDPLFKAHFMLKSNRTIMNWIKFDRPHLNWMSFIYIVMLFESLIKWQSHGWNSYWKCVSNWLAWKRIDELHYAPHRLTVKCDDCFLEYLMIWSLIDNISLDKCGNSK